MNWLQILIQIEPLAPQIVADLRALFAKNNVTDPAAQQALVQILAAAASTADDQALALIAADQAAHKGS